MSLKKMDNFIDRIVYGLVGLVSTGFVFLVRTVLTNNKKVVLMEHMLDHKEKEEERRHEETKQSIDRLVETHEKAIENQNLLITKLLDRQ